MPLFLKTVRGVYKFCHQLAPECTKLMKVGIFLELDTLIVRGFALLALAHEMFN